MDTRWRWLTAKYETRCWMCLDDIERGDTILWNPLDRAVICADCGTDVADCARKDGDLVEDRTCKH